MGDIFATVKTLSDISGREALKTEVITVAKSYHNI
jgi:hypothetical protein